MRACYQYYNNTMLCYANGRGCMHSIVLRERSSRPAAASHPPAMKTQTPLLPLLLSCSPSHCRSNCRSDHLSYSQSITHFSTTKTTLSFISTRPWLRASSADPRRNGSPSPQASCILVQSTLPSIGDTPSRPTADASAHNKNLDRHHR